MATYEELCESLLITTTEDTLLQLKDKIVTNAIYKYKLVKEFGILSIFLKEIINYNYLNSNPNNPKITQTILEILNILTDINEFIIYSINSNLLLFLYPIINSNIRTEPVESLKYLVLKIIKSVLFKNKLENTIEFFKNTELVPLCLRNMELSNLNSKIESSNILYLILSTREGLEYSCQTYDRFIAISMILNSVLVQLENNPNENPSNSYNSNSLNETANSNSVLLELIIKIYTKLCDMPNAKLAFNKNRPHMLYSETIREVVRNNVNVKVAYEEFLNVLMS